MQSSELVGAPDGDDTVVVGSIFVVGLLPGVVTGGLWPDGLSVGVVVVPPFTGGPVGLPDGGVKVGVSFGTSVGVVTVLLVVWVPSVGDVNVGLPVGVKVGLSEGPPVGNVFVGLPEGNPVGPVYVGPSEGAPVGGV